MVDALSRALRTCMLSVALAGAAACASAEAADAALSALVTDPRLSEISGMAASRRHEGVLWVHNDSDDGPLLFAVDHDGAVLSELALESGRNTDWEDIAAFTLDGRDYLMIADTGDNGGVRSQLQLLVVEEPAELVPRQRADIAWQLDFRWPDGARDCEALAVDAADGWVYLVAKKRVPPQLLRLPLRPADDGPLVAEAVASLTGIVQPSAADLERNPVYGRYRSQITAVDISRDRRRMAVLNYRTAYVYARRGDEGWDAAVAREPRELTMPWLPQAEAVAFDADGATLWISSEKLPAPLLRLAVPQQ